MKSVSSRRLVFFDVEPSPGPPADLFETGDQLVFEIDLPGVEPEKLCVRVYEDLLVIEGVGRRLRGTPGCGSMSYICVERECKSFRRVIRMPVAVNTQAGRAVYSHGVLTVTFPKLTGKVIRIPVERR
jgi:HSP20 family protein